jgi:hypothetical protein
LYIRHFCSTYNSKIGKPGIKLRKIGGISHYFIALSGKATLKEADINKVSQADEYFELEEF